MHASLTCTTRCDASVTISEIGERVEAVFQQPPLPQDFVEQLRVLDAGGELPSQFVAQFDELVVVHARRAALEDHRCRARAASRAAAR